MVLGGMLVVLAVRSAATAPLVEVQERLAAASATAVAAHLGGTTATAEALCRALADAVAAADAPDRATIDRLVRSQFDHVQYDAVIAGGGVWPEPGELEPGQARAAVFYSRDAGGRLAVFPGYNDASAPAYQEAAWYLPVRTLRPGATAWSPAYRDPHSQVAMVTCTVPVHRFGRLWGAATVDVRLDGLAAFCAANPPAGGGYLAVFDRELRPMHLPIPASADASPTAAELAARDAAWAAPAAQLAAFAAAPEVATRRAAWADDPLLHDAATVWLATLPGGSNWTVPAAVPAAEAAGIAGRVAAVVAVPALLTLVLLVAGAHWLVVRPLTRMTAALHAAGDDPAARLGVDGPGEVGELAAALDRRAVLLGRALGEREEARAALAAGEERLRRVLAELGELVVRCAADGRVLYANPAWARAAGRDEAACAGGSLYADISAEDWDRWRAAVAGLAPAAPATELECRLAGVTGARWVAWALTGSFAADGRLDAFLAVGRDVTRARAAEDGAARARRQLIQADRMIALGLLTSSVAHEVQNPNQVVTMNAQLLARVWADLDPVLAGLDRGARLGGLPAATVRAKAPELLAGIGGAAQRIASIVGDLRTFARPERDDVPLLLDRFVAEAAGERGQRPPAVARETLQLLGAYHFPSNVRELRALAFDVVAAHKGGPLGPALFRARLGATGWAADPAPAGAFPFPDRLPTLRELEQHAVDEALRRADGNQSVAAQLLGISKQALSKRLAREGGEEGG